MRTRAFSHCWMLDARCWMLDVEHRVSSFLDKKLEQNFAQAFSKGLSSIKHRVSCLLLCILCLALFCTVAESSSSSRGAFSFSGFATGAGTRAMGMNGAFAAVSDDSSSAYWNPAGLTSAWYKEISFTRADLYDLDLITNNVLSVSAPETRAGAISFGWNQLRYDFESWREEAFLLSYAKTVAKERKFSLSCGATFKYLRQTSKLDIAAIGDEEGEDIAPVFCKARGMGLDIGVLARMRAKDGRNRLSVGIAAHHIPTLVRWNSGERETEEYIPYRYEAGLSCEPLPRLNVALDLVGEQDVTLKEIHLGMEHWIFPVKYSLPITEKNLAIRGGIARQLSASKRMTFAGGLGIRWNSWQLDYAYLMDSDGLGDTRNRFSISVRF